MFKIIGVVIIILGGLVFVIRNMSFQPGPLIDFQNLQLRFTLWFIEFLAFRN